MEKCDNCGRTIGNLETPHLYDNHVVCSSCWSILKDDIALSSEDIATTPRVSYRVEGVDRSTGQPATRYVTASTETEARTLLAEKLVIKTVLPSVKNLNYAAHRETPETIRALDATTSKQRWSALISCIGIVCIVIGAWMFRASDTFGRYAWMETPGAILSLFGIAMTFGGISYFAIQRMKQ